MNIVIPARYGSSRFPGKVLVDLLGKSMLHRVYENCLQSKFSPNVVVATDDPRIMDHCQNRDMVSIMTSMECLTGTDRIYEATLHLDLDGPVVNVQADEPLLSADEIDTVIEAAVANGSEVFCGMTRIWKENQFRSINVPKVVCGPGGYLLYMSRAPIPATKDDSMTTAYKQVCIYYFSRNALMSFGKHGKKGDVEGIEDIEILRFLELGYKVKMVELECDTMAIDCPEDVSGVISKLQDLGV